MNRILIFLLLIVSSSLYAQQYDLEATYIPYRKGKLWGLADTSGNIVVEPKYTTIEEDESVRGVFEVTKARQNGILSPNKEIVPLGPNQEVSIWSDFVQVIYKEKKSCEFYNFDGVRILTIPTYNRTAINYIMSNYFLFKTDTLEDKANLYFFNKKTQEFDLVVNYKVKEISLKEISFYDYGNKFWIIDYQGNKTSHYIKSISLEEDESQHETGNFIVHDNNQIEFIYEVSAKPKEVETTKRVYVDIRENENMDSIMRVVKTTYDHEIYEQRTRNVDIFSDTSKLKYSIGNFRKGSKKYSSGYYRIGNTSYNESYYLLVQKLNKKGKVEKQGFITSLLTFEPQFETVEAFFSDERNYNQSFFVVSKKVKRKTLYGIILADGTWQLPLQSDFEITDQYFRRFETIVIRKDNKLGLMDLNFNIIIPPKYERIEHLSKKNHSVRTYVSGKYGICYLPAASYLSSQYDADYWQDKVVIVPPIFKDIPYDFKSFANDFKVIRMHNADDEFIGYALPNGTLLYED